MAWTTRKYPETGVGSVVHSSRDQRITQDVSQFTQQLSAVFNLIVINPLIVVYYTYALAEINGGLGPVSVYAYFVVGAIINKTIMSPLVALIFRKVFLIL